MYILASSFWITISLVPKYIIFPNRFRTSKANRKSFQSLLQIRTGLHGSYTIREAAPKVPKRARAVRGRLQQHIEKQKEKEKPKIQVAPCKQPAPFWWKADNKTKEPVTADVEDGYKHRQPLGPVDQTCTGRWIEEPNLAGFVQDDPCRRKYDINLVGQPFKTEACNWYYKNYPSPDIQFRPKRFA
ncbi:hypothetical protein NQ315_006420 [Exocentrus adspersus]|uniref:Uncharacterized protein n=1 Tax=Exocentrus adspersus TaxID=1586481 RepID=A0AAV8VZY2_9CUCU|nr:hypothetical protein NQ315_006420 [Exocentrus adspersus]